MDSKTKVIKVHSTVKMVQLRGKKNDTFCLFVLLFGCFIPKKSVVLLDEMAGMLMTGSCEFNTWAVCTCHFPAFSGNTHWGGAGWRRKWDTLLPCPLDDDEQIMEQGLFKVKLDLTAYA